MPRRSTPLDPEGGPHARFALALRRLRDEAGFDALTIDAIAARSGIPRSTLYAAMRGERIPTVPVLAVLVRAWNGGEAEWLKRRRRTEEEIEQLRQARRQRRVDEKSEPLRQTERYPLVERREYRPASKRGGFLNRRVTRDDDELPRLSSYHVRVFQVGEEYVEDHGWLRPADPTVVEASSVTVVDRRVDVPIVVETRIPSAEASDFTVRITFYCTVTDPCMVVRDGITDVEALLLGHLRAVPGLVEEGSDQPIVGLSAVRARIDARLTAYHKMCPVVLSGLRARHGVVEVLSPKELAGALAHQDENRRERERPLGREAWEQEAALRRALLETELEIKREELRNTSAVHEERNQQEREMVRNRFTRAELAEHLQLNSADLSAADFQAWRSGDLTSDELAQRLESRLQAGREAELQRRSFEQEDERRNLERQDPRHELPSAEAADRRREEARRWDPEDADGLRRRQEGRADAERLQRDEREWAKKVLAVKARLSRQAIEQGVFDSSMHDVDEVIHGVRDVVPPDVAQQAGQIDERAQANQAVEQPDSAALLEQIRTGARDFDLVWMPAVEKDGGRIRLRQEDGGVAEADRIVRMNGEHLRGLRKVAGAPTVRQLAQESQLPFTLVSAILRGAVPGTSDHVARILHALSTLAPDDETS